MGGQIKMCFARPISLFYRCIRNTLGVGDLGGRQLNGVPEHCLSFVTGGPFPGQDEPGVEGVGVICVDEAGVNGAS
ncbi:hypothetical protein QP028_12655 [Corynebacterium suedekumii]|nr:hypothetical protein QP028_12655 [Corynebacterium suedekumii]